MNDVPRDSAALAARVEELETQFAFQDELHRRLDEAVARQDREILDLKRQLKALAQRLEEVREAAPGGDAAVDEVPPHY